MADGEVVVAEADECSRWIITGLSCVACVFLSCISFLAGKHVDEDSLMVLPVLLLIFTGLMHFITCCFLLYEQCTGIYTNPRRSLADDMLMFFN
jgi:hypothetical protein